MTVQNLFITTFVIWVIMIITVIILKHIQKLNINIREKEAEISKIKIKNQELLSDIYKLVDGNEVVKQRYLFKIKQDSAFYNGVVNSNIQSGLLSQIRNEL